MQRNELFRPGDGADFSTLGGRCQAFFAPLVEKVCDEALPNLPGFTEKVLDNLGSRAYNMYMN